MFAADTPPFGPSASELLATPPVGMRAHVTRPDTSTSAAALSFFSADELVCIQLRNCRYWLTWRYRSTVPPRECVAAQAAGDLSIVGDFGVEVKRRGTGCGALQCSGGG